MKTVIYAILLSLLIAGCAGISTKSQTCIEDAVNPNQEKSEELDRRRAEPRVTDSCEKISQDGNLAIFHCDVAGPIDDEDSAHLLEMYMWSLRMNIEGCLP